ncbi:HAMP domain-containing histidine kinase [Reichenbachiella carrageenanivorans]|uniref:histidine kinase n=1 Tax=Reichenbachiella carrageenanivorans TaxID=2979869 RepID=A0ABY6CYG2_9BACT|nr:HAMP domain-containing sensor histidine kinase [Reichenbachiella carrageenanivorans]UXX78424.1 HAMP domain-containing histidine kinase [Reichenbachiella carrageenanivorans]
MKNKVRDSILKRSSFIILMLLILSAFALLRMLATHQDIDDVARIDLPLVEILTQIETNQLEQSINFERALRYAEELDKHPFALENFQRADSTFRYLAAMVDEDLIAAEGQVSEALNMTESSSQLSKLKGLAVAVRKLESEHTNYENHAIEVLELLEQGDLETAMIKSERVESEENEFNNQIEGVLMRLEMFTESQVESVEQEEELSMQWIVVLTIFFTTLSLVAVYTFSYKIWVPLEQIRKGAERLGAGNLDTRIQLKPESITEDLVDAFNSMADRLQDAQEEIERFTHFSYSTAHDLKAPVNNMKSLIEMLENTKMGDNSYDTVLKNVKRSAEQLSMTVNALNDVNHLRASLHEDPQILSFDKVLAEVAQGMLQEIKDSNATFRKDFSACKQIKYPPLHLKSILQNLLTNAVKYKNPEKPLVIELKTIINKGRVTLIVKDTGLGFDAVKYKEEIMKPFVRLHSHVNGSGLGLYIINTILSYHHGELLVDSRPKQGARFTIHLNEMD